ncbi:hypothetical protein [Streptomyces durhamensis]|uniref:hypothetical protein n=1 Tax=Streptomyces durhamensis TaxID=68194 RepID=UPI0007C64008|nr:hypothetical protein [Streptomyces durhamensis]
MEWQEHGVTLLPVGTLFVALRLPGALVHAAAASTKPADVDGVMKEALEGGPVICDQHRDRYYVLLPSSVPRTWREAVKDWQASDVAVIGRGAYLGVPRLDADRSRPGIDSYWAVPMDSPAVLCRALHVARLIAAGHESLTQSCQEDATDTPASVTGLHHEARQRQQRSADRPDPH